MNLFTQEDLERLEQHRNEHCVSIYAPLERGGPQKRGSEISLKNQIQEAERLLEQTGLRKREISGLMDPARRLLEDMPYLDHDSDGLALFVSPEFFAFWRLPVHFEPVAVLSDEFHIKPLVPLLTDDGRYYVLALSQNSVRLLQCTRHSLRRVTLRDVPVSLDEALRWDEVARAQSAHVGEPGGEARRRPFPPIDRSTVRGGHAWRPGGIREGGGGMVFHTQADDSDKSVHKENIKQFLLMVENGVTKLLARQSAPLVTAGVEEIRSIYAEANGYGNLMEPGIEGNPDRMKNRDLQAAGWQIVEPVFTKAREDAIDFYNQVSGSDRASDDLHVVLKAAEQGRVQYLLADLQREKWGTYDSEHDLVELHPEEQPGDEDLVNRAVLHTLLHGGEVFALPSDEMPDGDYLAAVFRF